MINPWLNLPKEPPYVLPDDLQHIRRANLLCASTGGLFEHRYAYQTQLYPDPFTGRPDAPVLLFTLNPGYTDDATAVGKARQGVVGSDDWWHANSAVMRAYYSANLRHQSVDYPLFFLDPQLRKSPAGAYYHRQLKELICEFGAEVVARCVCVVEFFPYHSRKYRALAKVPSQDYAIHLVREAIARNACIVIARSKRALFKAIPDLKPYPHIYVKSPQSGVLSRGNVDRFDDIREAIAKSETASASSE